MDVSTKTCSHCHETKSVSEYPKNKSSTDGYHPQCKVCTRQHNAESYARNRERRLAQMATYAAEHQEELKAYKKHWYDENHERIATQRAADRTLNPEKYRAYRRHFAEQHPERIKEAREKDREGRRARTCRWKATHREQVSLYHRAYLAEYMRSEENRKRARHAQQSFRKRHPEKGAAYEAKRRALRKYSPRVEKIDRMAIIERDHASCHICGKKVHPKDMTLDHLIPLAVGGSHTADNLAVAHRSCNSKRGIGKTIPAQLRILP